LFNDKSLPNRVTRIHLFLLSRRKGIEVNLLIPLILFEEIMDRCSRWMLVESHMNTGD